MPIVRRPRPPKAMAMPYTRRAPSRSPSSGTAKAAVKTALNLDHQGGRPGGHSGAHAQQEQAVLGDRDCGPSREHPAPGCTRRLGEQHRGKGGQQEPECRVHERRIALQPRVYGDEVEAPDSRDADRESDVTRRMRAAGTRGRQREVAGRPVRLCRALVASVSRYDTWEREGRDDLVKSLLKILMCISSQRLIVEHKQDFLRRML
jgi:hypothetical protein